jgi:hypothetical protein
MTRDEIYDHLAQVYLGKKNSGPKVEEKRKLQFNAWLLINAVITIVIFTGSVYGLTAFLANRGEAFHNKIIYALNNGPVRIKYNLNYPYPPVKTFSFNMPAIDAGKYKALQFSVRGTEDGYPGMLRVEIKNEKNEVASTVIQDVIVDWKNFSIPLEKFDEISDWTNLSEVSFILESWNIEKKKGVLLIDNVCFSG